jgi:hypothetical protein
VHIISLLFINSNLFCYLYYPLSSYSNQQSSKQTFCKNAFNEGEIFSKKKGFEFVFAGNIVTNTTKHTNYKEETYMITNRRSKLLAGGLAVLFTFGGLAGCGDGVDQDNGISDGEQKDAIDKDTKKEADTSFKDAKENLKEAKDDIEKELKDKGVGDGVDQDNGISDGEKKDEPDNL